VAVEPFVRCAPSTRLDAADQWALLGRSERPDPDWPAPPAGTLDLMVGVRTPGPAPEELTVPACAAELSRVLDVTAGPGTRLVIARGTEDTPRFRHLGLKALFATAEERSGFAAERWGDARWVERPEGSALVGVARLAQDDLDAAVRILHEDLGAVLLVTADDLDDPAALERLVDDLRGGSHIDRRHLPAARAGRGDVVGLPIGDVDWVERRVDWLGQREALQALLKPDGRAALDACVDAE
jgi:hypothetical protein